MVASLGGPLRAQAPDFSGYWQINTAASQIAANTATMWMRVDQSGDVLQVNLRSFSKDGGEENQIFVYTVGSADNHNTMHGGPMVSRVARVGDAVTFHSETRLGADLLVMDDDWTLSADGNRLTYRETSQFAQEAPRQARYVFERRAATDWPAATNDPAEKVFSNISVLTGRPASEVPTIMAGFARALGRPCTQCHVPGLWASADKPQFAVAREMVGMSTSLSQGLLKDRGGITCWTCHRGQLMPARFPSAQLAEALAGWPSDLAAPDALKTTMSVYTRSLGTTCDFCHVPGDWKNLSKPPMQAMPTMLAIFGELPKLSPVAANRAQCWMCHQGHRIPERVPAG